MRKFVLFALVLFADLITKYWVHHHLPMIQLYMGYPFGGIGVFETSWVTFSIVRTVNTGIAWGMLADFQLLLLISRILITAGILSYLLFFKVAKHFQLPLTLIVAGATGNILDYFLYGHVIDMFYFIFHKYSYPIFNVADAAIFCGVVYLLLTSNKKRRPHHARP